MRARRLTAVLVVVVLMTAACASSDDGGASAAEPTPEPTSEATADAEPTPEPDEPEAQPEPEDEPTVDPVEEDPLTDTALDAELQAATDAIIAEMFTCTTEPAEGLTAGYRGVTEDTISIAFLENDWTTLEALNVAVPLGPEGTHFTTFIDEINDCGGVYGRQIEVNVHVFDPVNFEQQDATCLAVAAEQENLMAIVRVTTREAPLCITETNEMLLFSLNQEPSEFYQRSGGRLFTVDPPGDELLRLAARDFIATGVIGPDNVVGIARDDQSQQTLAVQDGLIPELEAAGIAFVEVVTPNTGLGCEGYTSAVERLTADGADTLFATLSPLCYPNLVAEATAQGWFPQYLATPFGGGTSDVSTQRMVDSGDAFDGAVGFTTLPANPPFSDQPPPAFEDACNAITNEALGYELVAGDTIYGAITGLCTVAWIVHRALEAAGPDLTQESMIAGLESLAGIPLRRGGIGTYGPDKHTAVTDVGWGQTFSAECNCWVDGNGPRRID